jgi:putative oxidoreductase
MTWAETYLSWQPRVLSLLRIMTGLLFLQYGMAKLLKFPAVPAFKDVTLFSLYGLAGTLELVGGALMILGLFTRPVAFILAGEMAFAYFLGHAPRGSCPSSMAAISRSCSALCPFICPSPALAPGVSMPCGKNEKCNSASTAERRRIDFDGERCREGRAAKGRA